MKALFFFLIGLIWSDFFSQGNLQFDKILTYTGYLGNPPYHASNISPTWTVPTGKVWKIESLTTPGAEVVGGAVNGNYAGFYFYLNGIAIEKSGTSQRPPLPIWLKTNDAIFFSSYSSLGAGVGYYISILEFNIIP
jgi:hypothetical protein